MEHWIDTFSEKNSGIWRFVQRRQGALHLILPPFKKLEIDAIYGFEIPHKVVWTWDIGTEKKQENFKAIFMVMDVNMRCFQRFCRN